MMGLISYTSQANNVQITNITKSGGTISFDLSWENSWRSTFNYFDAVWIFVKQAPNGGPSWEHANIASATVGFGYDTVIPSDQVGFFVQRQINGSGTASTSVDVSLSGLVGIFQDIKVMGIEMVYVPGGGFNAGDGGSNDRIARGDNVLESIFISGSGALACGSQSTQIQYESGPCTDIPATFPNGFDAFYCMKYAITQSQYVDFLNCLNRSQQENRVRADVTNSTVSNVFVLCDDTSPQLGNVVSCPASIGSGNITFYCDRNNNGVPNESDDGMSRACNFLRVTDWMAYLDWCGLRPFSFLEAEKAARGGLPAVANEYSWGSTLHTSPGILQNAGTSTEKWSNSTTVGGISTINNAVIRVGCNAPSSSATRELSNASFYGIIDLGNNPGDYYISQQYVTTFQDIEGDGTLSTSGEADVSTWPVLDPLNAHKIKLPSPTTGFSQLSIISVVSGNTGGRGVRSNF